MQRLRALNLFWVPVVALIVLFGAAAAAGPEFVSAPLAPPSGQLVNPEFDWREGADSRIAVRAEDQDAGTYRLMWQRPDSPIRSVTYHVPDRVVVSIRAQVTTGKTKSFRYEYDILSSKQSRQAVYGIALQMFSDDVVFVHPSDRRVGSMSPRNPELAAGTWFRVPYWKGEFSPGLRMNIVVESDLPPALVNVRAHGGPLVISGIGEDIPSDLLDRLPNFESWPAGITLGPVRSTQDGDYSFAKATSAEYLTLMKDAGWISREDHVRYTNLLESGPVERVLVAMKDDVGGGRIASEVPLAFGRAFGK